MRKEIKKRETEHKAGKEDGIYLIYYENGQKEATGPYTSEARIGEVDLLA